MPDMSAITPLDLPGQHSSSLTPVPPNQPLRSQTITLSTEFLESLLTRAITAAATVSSSAPQVVVQPSILAMVAEPATPPPFVVVPTTVLSLGTSLFDRFPQVEAGTILEVTQHNFKPMDLFKLDPAMQDKNLEWKATLDVEGGILTATSHGGSLCDYPMFSSLLEPLLIYLNILMAYAASSGDMLMAAIPILVISLPSTANFSKVQCFNTTNPIF